MSESVQYSNKIGGGSVGGGSVGGGSVGGGSVGGGSAMNNSADTSSTIGSVLNGSLSGSVGGGSAMNNSTDTSSTIGSMLGGNDNSNDIDDIDDDMVNKIITSLEVGAFKFTKAEWDYIRNDHSNRNILTKMIKLCIDKYLENKKSDTFTRSQRQIFNDNKIYLEQRKEIINKIASSLDVKPSDPKIIRIFPPIPKSVPRDIRLTIEYNVTEPGTHKEKIISGKTSIVISIDKGYTEMLVAIKAKVRGLDKLTPLILYIRTTDGNELVINEENMVELVDKSTVYMNVLQEILNTECLLKVNLMKSLTPKINYTQKYQNLYK
jgi:hypothetical protein